MFRNYAKIAIRNLKRYKGFSFIIIAGLSVSISVILLILLYIQYELSFDRYHKNADQIYRVVQEFPYFYGGKNQAPITPGPMASTLMDEVPDVVTASRLLDSDDVLISYSDKNFTEKNFYFADPQLFDIFSIALIKDHPQKILNDPYSVVLSENMARKYFGDQDPIDKTIRYEDKYDFRVTGIIQNMPHNSHFRLDFVVPFDAYELIRGRKYSSWYQSAFYTYMLLHKDAHPKAVETKITAMVEKHWDGSSPPKIKYFLQPLTKIHLYSTQLMETVPRRDVKNIYFFASN